MGSILDPKFEQDAATRGIRPFCGAGQSFHVGVGLRLFGLGGFTGMTKAVFRSKDSAVKIPLGSAETIRGLSIEGYMSERYTHKFL